MQRLLAVTVLLCIVLSTGILASAKGHGVDFTDDFSGSTTEWHVFGTGVLNITTEQARSGTQSIKMSGRRDAWNSAAVDLHPILADGGTYNFSIYVRLPENVDRDVYGHFTVAETLKDGSTNYTWLCDDVPLSNDGWVLIESDAYTFDGQNITKAWLYVEVSDGLTPYYLDDFSITGDKPLQGVSEATEQSFQHELPALKEVFAEYFHFGVATSPHLLAEQSIYSPYVSYHYNVLVAGNSMKPDALQPIEGLFSWSQADRFVDFAERNDMLLRGHTLLWHNQVPNWFFVDSDKRTQPATAEVLIDRLETHIKTVVGKYKGKIYSWDVVNEVLNDAGGLRDANDGSKWKGIIGDVDGDGYESDYIELAFKFAREADPDVELIINDYGIESRGAKRTGMYNLVKRMLEKGVPVDGVGLQMHIDIYGPSASEIEESIELFASLKEYNPEFTVVVTEMDMSVYRWQEGKKEITNEHLELQAERYGEIFDVFRRQAEKGNLNTVVLWGLGDMDSWLENYPVHGRGDAGLLYDKQMEAKPAYYKIIRPDRRWYVTKAEHQGALSLFSIDGQLVGKVKPGEYTIPQLNTVAPIRDLNQAQLAKGFVMEVYPKLDSITPKYYVGDEQKFNLRMSDLGDKIIIKEDAGRNLVLNRPTDASHNADRAGRAVDGQLISSWSANDAPPYWLSVDLGKPYILTNWVVHHREAGGFNPTMMDGPLNTSSFALQTSEDGLTWQDADIIEDNISSKTDRTITPIEAQYVRILITKPTSLELNQEAVIYEFEVYGLDAK
ncbi:MAG: endo-1,4-beta-xylanase [Bacillota bacterium]|nr:endo-1,4-beta-xylanase [Bacillota bacterium]